MAVRTSFIIMQMQRWRWRETCQCFHPIGGQHRSRNDALQGIRCGKSPGCQGIDVLQIAAGETAKGDADS
jgi:hypothetical protein